MNFQQLRIIRETVRCNYNLTEVADSLYTSQSGVSKHIKDLEEELGVELFIRKGKRFLGMTEPGREMLALVERILLDTRNIKNLADDYSQQDQGQLSVAATHTQARYILPDIVVKFRKHYPNVKLRLHQGTPQEIAQMLLEGRADIGIATEILGNTDGLKTFQSHRWHHGVLVSSEHELLKLKAVSLKDITRFPIVTYHEGFTGRALIENTFKNEGLEPNIVLSALDADVIKSYVELDMGIGIVASVAFNPDKDKHLRFIECSHLFHENISFVAIRNGHLLRKFALNFLSLCSNEDIEKDVCIN